MSTPPVWPFGGSQDPIGYVFQSSGPAFIITESSSGLSSSAVFTPATPGTWVYPGQILQTYDGGTLVVAFSAGLTSQTDVSQFIVTSNMESQDNTQFIVDQFATQMANWVDSLGSDALNWLFSTGTALDIAFGDGTSATMDITTWASGNCVDTPSVTTYDGCFDEYYDFSENATGQYDV